MAKVYKIVCDRCSKELGVSDEVVPESSGEICADCCLLIDLATSATEKDIKENNPVGTTLKKMQQSYE